MCNELEHEIIYIKDMSKSEAKKLIKAYFENDYTDIYPSTISHRLGIDYELVWEVIRELETEGFIEVGKP